MSAHVGRTVVALIVLGVFGPYLAGGVRTEQAAVYGLLAVCAPFLIVTTHIPAPGLRILLVWGCYILAALVHLASPVVNSTRWAYQSALAGLDNLLLPMATMLLIWTTCRRIHTVALLEFSAKLVAVAMAANGALAMIMTRVDLRIALRPWVGAEDETRIVANLAADLGRYSGVFSQPAEAGLAYSVAGLAACYAWRNRPTLAYLMLIPITLGGFLCVSKVFILGGLPLILWQVWRTRRAGKVALIVVGALAGVGLSVSGFLADWSGSRMVARLLDPQNGLLDLYTAGRFGQNSTLADVADVVWSTHKWFGYGVAGLRVPYDNGWIEAFVLAGLVGAAAYTGALLLMMRMARTEADRDCRSFLTSLAILAAGASLGLPALTANRAGTLLWLLVALGALAHIRRVPFVAKGPLVEAQPADRRG